MTVRLQYRVTGVAIDNVDKKKVTITLGASTGLGAGNARFQTETAATYLLGKADDGTTNGTRGHIRYSRDSWGGRTPDSRVAAGGLATIEVNCKDELEAQKVWGLLKLKEAVCAEETTRPKWEAWFSKINYDETAAWAQNKPETWIEMRAAANDMVLKPSSFSDGKVLENLHIDNITMDPASEANSTTIGADPAAGKFSDYAGDLIDLVDKLDEMNKHYTKDEGDLSRDIDADLNFLKPYNGAAVTTTAQKIYAITEYGDAVDLWNRRLKELKIWKEVVGLTSVNEVLMFNAVGFTISATRATTNPGTIALNGTSENNLNFDIQKNNTPATYSKDDISTWRTVKDFFPTARKYMGFDIIDLIKKENEVKVEDDVAGDDGSHIFNKRFRVNASRITKEKIEAFRRIVEFKDKTDPKDCRGFQPSDFSAFTPNAPAAITSAILRIGGPNVLDATAEIVVNTVWDSTSGNVDTTKDDKSLKHNTITKKCFEILDAGDENVALGLFLKNEFTETKDNRSVLLEMYYKVIRSTNMTNVDYSAGKGDIAKGDKSTNPAKLAERIDKAYDLLKGVITVLDESPTDQAGYDAWKKKLDAIIAKKNDSRSSVDEKTLGEYWGDGDRYREITNEKKAGIGKKKGPKNDDITAADITKKVGELQLTSGDTYKELIKKMFDNTDEIIKGKKALLDKLVELAEMIDKALKDGNSVQKSSLEAIRDDKTGKGAEAWKLAEAVKDTKGKILTALALEKATGKPKQDDLAAAKTAAETAMKAKMATGGKEAYDKIIKSSTTLTSAELVKDAAEIFGKCYDAWKATKENDSLRNKLAEYDNATDGDKKTVWVAINLFKKNADNEDDNDGFGKGALKHLQGLSKERKKIIERSKIDKANNEVSVKSSLAILETEKDNDEKIRDVVIPRGKLMLALFKKGDNDSKALAMLVRDNFIKDLETDYDDSTYATNLEKLEKKLKELQEFKSGGKSKVYDGLGGEEKGTFDKLVSSVESKVKAMQAKKDAAEKGNTPTEEKSFWGGPWGVVSIIAIVAVVLGGIVWLIKSNSSSGEEGEGE